MIYAGPIYPIPSAADLPLFGGGNLPQVQDAFTGWMLPIVMARVIKTQVNFRTVEVDEQINTRGMIKPMSTRRLEMKPEGERNWEWLTLHATPDLVLENDSIVKFSARQFAGRPFRIMGQRNWANYGFVRYELVNDYEYSARS